MIVYWIIIILLTFFSILLIHLSVKRWKEDDTERSVGNIILALITSFITFAILYWASYTIVPTDQISPAETTMMYDFEEIVVKYNGYRWVTTEHAEYVQVIDSNFYIQKNAHYNIFDKYTGDSHDFVITKEKFTEPVKIKL
jgi:heme/copper-type cytochrome/quinol oxidase subunit 2